MQVCLVFFHLADRRAVPLSPFEGMTTQSRRGEGRIGEDRIGQRSIDERSRAYRREKKKKTKKLFLEQTRKRGWRQVGFPPPLWKKSRPVFVEKKNDFFFLCSPSLPTASPIKIRALATCPAPARFSVRFPKPECESPFLLSLSISIGANLQPVPIRMVHLCR